MSKRWVLLNGLQERFSSGWFLSNFKWPEDLLNFVKIKNGFGSLQTNPHSDDWWVSPCFFWIKCFRETPYYPQRYEHYGLVIAQDFPKRRTNLAEFQLCQHCPAPQSQKGQPNYTINCEEHNLKWFCCSYVRCFCNNKYWPFSAILVGSEMQKCVFNLYSNRGQALTSTRG